MFADAVCAKCYAFLSNVPKWIRFTFIILRVYWYFSHNLDMVEIEQCQLWDTCLNDTPASISPSARQRISTSSLGYRFTKGLTQNLNLRTNLKLKYNIKSLNYIQPTFRFQASFLYYWTMSFTFSTWSVV